ncbi:MFS transporter [Daejeonella oryzae]|uniref:MFS transporter n=1 Tax=Daejeonella oryzae TaxID=1122943 RepID=UPI000423B94B|nr:MFS transporter [Daejeonella oryzae]
MKRILPVIVISQFLCTTLWFAGNAIINEIGTAVHSGADFLAQLTSIIQFGFITGTLVFAVLSISDRFSPSVVFFTCSILAGIFNLGIAIPDSQSSAILLFRFLTGFFLAGIYPVGMKIASDYYREGLGKSLGFLVGALVIGTAFPHLLKNLISGLPWKYVLFVTSGLSVTGGLCILLFIPDGPYRKLSQKFSFTVFMKVFKNPDFRAASFGYFGHMWELYTFWAFVPVMLSAAKLEFPAININVSLWSFVIIGSGGLACVFSGLLSQYFGAKRIAAYALFLSCLCCLTSPIFLFSGSVYILIGFLIFWGLTVVADSPLFSALVAKSAPAEYRGTSLTIVNCIGFSITILSIQFVNALSGELNSQFMYMTLAIGPVLGLIFLLKKRHSSQRIDAAGLAGNVHS